MKQPDLYYFETIKMTSQVLAKVHKIKMESISGVSRHAKFTFIAAMLPLFVTDYLDLYPMSG